MRNAKFYPWLLPYIEDDLDAARRARLETLLAADPALTAEAERLRRTRAHLQAAGTPPASAAVPADAWPRLRARLEPPPAPARPARGWWLAGAGATAAAGLVLGAILLPGWHTPDLPRSTPQTPPVVPAPPRVGQTAPAPAARAGRVPAPPAMSAHRVNVPPGPMMPPPVAAPKPLPPPVSADPFALPANGRASGPMSGRVAVSPLVVPSPAALPPAAPSPAHSSLAKSVPKPPPPPRYAAPMAAPPPAPMVAPPAPAPVPRNTMTQDAPTPGQSRPASAAGISAAAGQQPKALRGGATAKHHAAARFAPARALGEAPAAAGNTQDSLDGWQGSLAAAVQPPLWGEDAGMQQANQALLAAKEAGALDDLRARLEARRAQSPRDIATGRMLAAVYDFGFAGGDALRERRRIVGLEGAGGEDWYALAQAEEQAGGNAAARAAYKRALESPVPPTPFHAAVARQRE